MLSASVLKGLADLPKFMVSGELEKRLNRHLGIAHPQLPRPFSAASLKGTLRFARGASAGSLVGVATFPLFAHGTKQLLSDDPLTKARGLAEVVGSSLLYTAAKGATEHGFRHRMLNPAAKRWLLKSLGREPSLRAKALPYISGAVAKSIPGVAFAVLPALSAAYGMKKGESASRSALRTGLLGGVAAGGRALTERALFLRAMGQPLLSLRAAKELTAAAGGKAAAGALGGLLLDRLVRMALQHSAPGPTAQRKFTEKKTQEGQ